MTNNHFPFLYALRPQQVITRILVIPRRGPFQRDETLTLTLGRELHSVTYLKRDGRHRCLVLHNGTPMTYFNYQLSR